MQEHDETKSSNDLLDGPRIAPGKSILVHRCNLTHAKNETDYRCGCTERVTQAEANAKLQSGEAEWLTSERGGKKLTRRDSIVIWSGIDESLRIASERAAAHDAELERRAAKRKTAGKQKAIAKVISTFRKRLTPEENKRWPTDEDVVQAFQNITDDGGMKYKLLHSSNEEIAQESDYIEEMATTSRVYAALFDGAVKFWDVVLAYEGLPENKAEDKGRVMTFDNETLARIDGQRETEDGKCEAANFIPRPFNDGVIFGAGNGPDAFDDDQEARGIRERWQKEN